MTVCGRQGKRTRNRTVHDTQDRGRLSVARPEIVRQEELERSVRQEIAERVNGMSNQEQHMEPVAEPDEFIRFSLVPHAREVNGVCFYL